MIAIWLPLRTDGRRGNVVRRVAAYFACAVASWALVGCGTTRMSDTIRTGNEQLLLSAAIDRSINEMDFAALAGKEVYFDPQYMRGVTDEGYIVSSIRQRLLASGVYLRPTREEAMYIVEARAGAVGTNRHDVLLGVPQVSLPTMTGITGVPSAIPEIPFAKSTHQKGVAKLAVFAYNQTTGQPVWQSGTFPIAVDARDTWLLGTGPFQRGSIYDGTNFAGSRLLLPFGKDKPAPLRPSSHIPVTAEAIFTEKPGAAPPPRPELATKPKATVAAAPPLFQPAYPPSQPVPLRTPAPAAVAQPQVTSGLTTGATQGMTGGLSGGLPATDPRNASGGSAAAGFLILGNGIK